MLPPAPTLLHELGCLSLPLLYWSKSSIFWRSRKEPDPDHSQGASGTCSVKRPAHRVKGIAECKSTAWKSIFRVQVAYGLRTHRCKPLGIALGNCKKTSYIISPNISWSACKTRIMPRDSSHDQQQQKRTVTLAGNTEPQCSQTPGHDSGEPGTHRRHFLWFHLVNSP